MQLDHCGDVFRQEAEYQYQQKWDAKREKGRPLKNAKGKLKLND